MKKFVTILIILNCNFLLFSQLTTSTNLSPVQLVEDVLVGNGVAVSNVTYTGDLEAIGSFNGANTNLGLNSGIILTTGTVLNSNSGGLLGGPEGPHGPNNTGSAGLDNDAGGYQPLTNIANEETHDAAILEFDFVPTSDTVRFRYVFGSEEYPEFVDAGFNDVFAFFISGPGFGGTYNMATIPGTGGTPVTIDNVNANVNSTYFINNGDGSESPQNGSENYIQYDGFTVVIEAVAKVECGETYHLKLAIADVGDGAYDSGIFLEANSLTSYGPMTIEQSTTLNLPDDRVAEGCETATVTLTRSPNTINEALVIPITLAGTATELVDYSDIPSSISFISGQSTASFNFDIFDDGIAEGIENIIIEFNQVDPCGNDNLIFANFNIFDIEPLTVTVPDKSVTCAGDNVSLTAIVTGGVSDYTYEWSNGDTGETINVAPNSTSLYSVTVTDLCYAEPGFGSGIVNVPVYPPLELFTTNDTSVLCPNTPVLLAAEATGGQGTFTYQWIENNEIIGTNPAQEVSPMTTRPYTVKAIDGCNQVIEKDILFTVITPVLTIEMSPTQLVCPYDPTEISVEAFGGLGDFTYLWEHSGETQPAVIVTPNESTTYSVAVQDGCLTYYIYGETTVNVIKPTANFNVLSSNPMENLPVSFQNTSDGSVAWEWDFNNGDYSEKHSPNTTYTDWGIQNVELVAINEIGCKDTIVKQIYIKPEFHFYAPNAFTPDGNRFNNTYSVSTLGAKSLEFYIFNRWGELIYYSTDKYFEWDGTYNGEITPDETYTYKAIVTDRESTEHEYYGTITLLK